MRISDWSSDGCSSDLVARVELGASDYNSNTYLSGDPTVIMAVFQRPGSNALAAAEAVEAEMAASSKNFPKGLEYRVIYNPTEFIAQSIDAVMDTDRKSTRLNSSH